MDAGWCEGLIVLVSLQRHIRQVEDKVANVTEELVLVDIPTAQLERGSEAV